MTAGHRYSAALRCVACGVRALLTRDTAQAFVAESFGRLAMVECAGRDGWHVWDPEVEKVFVHG